MSKISCLHLSDIHIGKSRNSSIDHFYSTICRDLKSNSQKIDVIICTGDLINGKSKDKPELISRMIIFFEKLLERINIEILYNIKPLEKTDILFVPGNHDLDRENIDIFHFYSDFIGRFYGTRLKDVFINNNFNYTLKIFEKEKIALVGLNSCMIDNKIQDQDETWIENLDFKSISLKDSEDDIKKYLRQTKTGIDDYGEISTDQLLSAFDDLRKKIDLHSYKIVTFFHHHIYPFPEIYDKYGDSSMIRNFSSVINTLIDNNVRIVLHGHRHIPISRLITTNKYFENPEKSLYVFSTGTLENSDGQRAFEVVDVHSPNQMIDAEIFKYNYSGEELQKRDELCIPPKYNKRIGTIGALKNKLRQQDLTLFDKYKNEIEERDNVSTKYRINDLISNIENTLLVFDGIIQDLNRNPISIYTILAFIHYRVVVLESINSEVDNSLTLNYISKSLNSMINKDYLDEIEKLLMSKNNSEFNSKFKLLYDKSEFISNKKTTAYLAVTVLFTDLFLSINPYGEAYFNREGLNHKINIKLGDGQLDNNIPNSSIKILGEEDRRTATISFKCKNPTAHKIGVLIVKDFEERITKIEEAFKELNLKLYYIRPKIEKDSYELDNYNFEAYIPTLLPLLTGDNLYSQKEVFIRELIQNSFDAIKLREKLDKSNFDKTIYIEIGTEKREDGSNGRFLKIKDFGVGMDIYKIERYFTSIGRSFYTSDDFKELQKENKIQYKAVSNFGIGFLSVFMVCKEVKVRTKSLTANEGIDIHIPNYEGCFFINRNININDIGTEITIYQDERGLINTSNILKYIKENFLDFELKISVKYPNKERIFNAHQLKRDLPRLSLFIPFKNEIAINIDFAKILNKKFIDEYSYGCLIRFDFTDSPKTIILNSGIKVNNSSNTLSLPILSDAYSSVAYNFPSSFINLDVSRDRVLNIKINDIKSFNDSVKKSIAIQALDLVNAIESDFKDNSLAFVNRILNFKSQFNKPNEIIRESYSMLIFKNGEKFNFLACKRGEVAKFKDLTDLLTCVNLDGSILYPEKLTNYITSRYSKQKNAKKTL